MRAAAALVAGTALLTTHASAAPLVYVCQGTPVPQGYVIVNINKNSFTCGGLAQWTLQDISRETGLAYACANSLIPWGWAVVNVSDSFTCGGYKKLTLRRFP